MRIVHTQVHCGLNYNFIVFQLLLVILLFGLICHISQIKHINFINKFFIPLKNTFLQYFNHRFRISSFHCIEIQWSDHPLPTIPLQNHRNMSIGDPMSLVLDLVNCEHFAHYLKRNANVVNGVEILILGEYCQDQVELENIYRNLVCKLLKQKWITEIDLQIFEIFFLLELISQFLVMLDSPCLFALIPHNALLALLLVHLIARIHKHNC